MVFYIATLAATYTALWFGWLLAFVVIEITALYLDVKKKISNNEGGTLSETVRRLMKANRLVFLLFSVLWVVLAYHFVWG